MNTVGQKSFLLKPSYPLGMDATSRYECLKLKQINGRVSLFYACETCLLGMDATSRCPDQINSPPLAEKYKLHNCHVGHFSIIQK